MLTYSDVQRFWKRLRFNGHPLRYFVVGEYGGEKGRAHWHGVVYWQGKAPPLELRKEYYTEPHWPLGFSFWDDPSFEAIRYAVKYLQKDIGKAERQGHLAMSKKPPLGTEYFKRLAEQYVRQELAPQTLEYTFPEVRRAEQAGTPELIRFRLKDRPAELFLQHYVDTWRATFPGRHMPNSELVEEHLDPGAWADRSAILKAADLHIPEPAPGEDRRRGPQNLSDWEWAYSRESAIRGEGQPGEPWAESYIHEQDWWPDHWRTKKDDGGGSGEAIRPGS
ncbi:replication initiation protein [Tortoise microvirus 77]|nr:replication initiation protein [Tortoise microvirus 77]